jgi:hypothetical protein
MGKRSHEATVGNFLRSFWGQWLTRMSGPLTVPFAVLALYTSQTGPKLLFAAMAILCGLVSAYGVWAAERKARINLEKRIDELEWPSNRPRISFLEWGNVELQYLPTNHHPAMVGQKGFYLSNDGDVALEVRIDAFLIGDTRATSKIIPRIEGHSRGFALIWLASPSPIFTFELAQQLNIAAEAEINAHRMPVNGEYRIHVRATYRDFGNVWYSSEADLSFHRRWLRIEFGPVTQKQLGSKIQDARIEESEP